RLLQEQTVAFILLARPAHENDVFVTRLVVEATDALDGLERRHALHVLEGGRLADLPSHEDLATEFTHDDRDPRVFELPGVGLAKTLRELIGAQSRRLDVTDQIERDLAVVADRLLFEVQLGGLVEANVELVPHPDEIRLPIDHHGRHLRRSAPRWRLECAAAVQHGAAAEEQRDRSERQGTRAYRSPGRKTHEPLNARHSRFRTSELSNARAAIIFSKYNRGLGDLFSIRAALQSVMGLLARLQLFALAPTGMTRREYRMGRRFFALGSPPTRATASNLRAARAGIPRPKSERFQRDAAPGGAARRRRPASPQPGLAISQQRSGSSRGEPRAAEIRGRCAAERTGMARRRARWIAPNPRGCPTLSARCAGVAAGATAGLRPNRWDEQRRPEFHASFPPRNPCPRLCESAMRGREDATNGCGEARRGSAGAPRRAGAGPAVERMSASTGQ